MRQLEQLELILRRIAARRKQRHESGNGALNIDIQEFIEELSNEIARAAATPSAGTEG